MNTKALGKFFGTLVIITIVIVVPCVAEAGVVCALGGGQTPAGWSVQGVGGGVDATIAPFTPPSGASQGDTACVIVTDTGPGVGVVSTGFSPNNIGIAGTTNGTQMTSPAFTKNPGDQLNFQFMFFTNDGTGTFSDVARAALIDPITHAPVLDLFTARTGSTSQVVPGFGFSQMPAGLVLTPATSTLQGDSFALTDFGTGNGSTTYGPSRYGGGPGGSSPWVNASFTFDSATAGTYQLQMSVANVGDEIYSSGLAFAGKPVFSSPSVLPPSPLPTQFGFPLKGDTPVYLITQAGGLSSDQSELPSSICGGTNGQQVFFDPCHSRTQANYALDFAVQSGKENVVSAISGIAHVTTIKETIKDKNGKVKRTFYYPRISITQDGDTKFHTISSEFAQGDTPAQALANGKIPDIDGQHVNAGKFLGELTSGQGRHLHFQAEYGGDGMGFSKYSDSSPLNSVTVGGRLFKDYKLGGNAKVEYNSDNSFKDVLGTPTQAQIYGYLNPLMPTPELMGDPKSEAFKFNVVVGDLGVGNSQSIPIYVDPVLAVGYDYQILSGPNFDSVLLPNIGDGLFDLFLFDPVLSQWVFDSNVDAGVTHLFGSGGIDRFRILGIEASAALDPNDPNAFVTGLTFTDPGTVDFTMTPIQHEFNVDEPPTFALFGISLLGLAFIRRRINAGKLQGSRSVQS